MIKIDRRFFDIQFPFSRAVGSPSRPKNDAPLYSEPDVVSRERTNSRLFLTAGSLALGRLMCLDRLLSCSPLAPMVHRGTLHRRNELYHNKLRLST